MAVSAQELLDEAERLKRLYGETIDPISAAEAVLTERLRCEGIVAPYAHDDDGHEMLTAIRGGHQ